MTFSIDFSEKNSPVLNYFPPENVKHHDFVTSFLQTDDSKKLKSISTLRRKIKEQIDQLARMIFFYKIGGTKKSGI